MFPLPTSRVQLLCHRTNRLVYDNPFCALVSATCNEKFYAAYRSISLVFAATRRMSRAAVSTSSKHTRCFHVFCSSRPRKVGVAQNNCIIRNVFVQSSQSLRQRSEMMLNAAFPEAASVDLLLRSATRYMIDAAVLTQKKYSLLYTFKSLACCTIQGLAVQVPYTPATCLYTSGSIRFIVSVHALPPSCSTGGMSSADS